MNKINTYLKYKLIKDIFLLANEEGYDMEDFLTKFMSSKLCKKIFENGGIHFFNEPSVVADFVSEVEVKKTEHKLDQVIVAYYAYIYVNFYLLTGILPNKIMQFMPFKYILSHFDHFHLIDEKDVVEIVLNNFNKNQNALRKQRSVSNINILKEAKSKELSHQSIELYNKLFPSAYLSDLAYKVESFAFFESENAFICANKADSVNEVKNIINDSLLNSYAFRKRYAINFIYVSKNLTADNLKKIKSSISLSTNFWKFIIVEDRCVHIFNSFAEYDKYYYVYSKSDFKKAHKNYLSRFDKQDD